MLTRTVQWARRAPIAIAVGLLAALALKGCIYPKLETTEGAGGQAGSAAGSSGASGATTGGSGGASGSGGDAMPDGKVDAGDAGSAYYLAVLEAGPLLYWRDATGWDYSGHGNKAKVMNCANVVPGGVGDETAIELCGGYMEGPGTLDFVGQAQFTFEAWVRQADTSTIGWARIASNENQPDGRDGWDVLHVVWDGGLTEITFERWESDKSSTALSDASLSGSTFVHLVALYTGTASQIWINGVKRADTPNGKQLIDTTLPFRVGVDDNGNYPFKGIIDEIAVYDKALSQPEILAHYQLGAGL